MVATTRETRRKPNTATRAAKPDGNRALCEISAQLALAIHDASEWLAEHPADCRCNYCAADRDESREYVRDALRGVTWSMEMCRSVLWSATSGSEL